MAGTYRNLWHIITYWFHLTCVQHFGKVGDFDGPDSGGPPHNGRQDIQAVEVIGQTLRVHVQLVTECLKF